MDSIARQARRITRTLLAAQAAGSAAFIAMAAVTSIVGVDLGGHAALAGLPAAVYRHGRLRLGRATGQSGLSSLTQPEHKLQAPLAGCLACACRAGARTPACPWAD